MSLDPKKINASIEAAENKSGGLDLDRINATLERDAADRGDRAPRVCIAVPNGNGAIHKWVVFKLLAMMSDHCGCQVRFILPTWAPSEHNRARISEEVIYKTGEDFVLMVDSDNPPERNPLELVKLDLDVVTCPTPVWCNRTGERQPGTDCWYWNALRYTDKAPDGTSGLAPIPPPVDGADRLVEVDAVGAGCILVARRVLVALAESQPWMRTWDAIGKPITGSDYAFCERAKAAGFRIWAHFDYPCDHMHAMSLLEAIGVIGEYKEFAYKAGYQRGLEDAVAKEIALNAGKRADLQAGIPGPFDAERFLTIDKGNTP